MKKPCCFVITYAVTGECIVNVNAVERTESEPQGERPNGRCRLYFKDGSELLLDESCYEYGTKICSPEVSRYDPEGNPRPIYGEDCE